MKGQLNIDTLYAFIARDNDGTEGVMGTRTLDGWMPLVGADPERMESLEFLAQEAVNATGLSVQLVHFTNREDIRTLVPNRMSETTAERKTDMDGSVIEIRGKNDV